MPPFYVCHHESGMSLAMFGADTIESFTPRRVAVVGAGPMGASLAALLAQRLPVVVVCRNPSRAAEIFSSGVRVTGVLEAAARPIVVRSLEDLASIGGVSLVFIATKTTAIDAVAHDLRPLMRDIADQPGAPFVISYQNGIDPGLQIRTILGDPRVLRMVLNFGATMRSGGVVEASLFSPPNYIGCVESEHGPVCRTIAALLTSCGFPTEFDPAIDNRVWEKGVVNAAMNPVAALVNATVGQVLDSPARAIVERLLAEGLAVARAEGCSLGPEPLDAALRAIERGRSHLPSMVQDIRDGRESEVGQLNRQVIQHGARLGVPTPTHQVIDALIETFDWKIYARNQ